MTIIYAYPDNRFNYIDFLCMMKKEFELTQEYIELFKLLKVTNIAATGGHAKILIDEGDIHLNGKVEYRKRAKIRKGDVISFENIVLEIK